MIWGLTNHKIWDIYTDGNHIDCCLYIFFVVGEQVDENPRVSPVITNNMFGRLDIYASFDDITDDNIVGELNSALVYHVQNLLQENFLYWYRRNVQPILRRHKEVRPDILNIVQENHADEIVTFKNGFFLV